jgi:hypothetical protein
MATTTPNFGWAVPTSTDLVKDGAVAIETLGDSIDASLVDLKGGTTGQVLSKASGTDMDFAWVSDAAGMTNPMTTTGDTIYSSSGSTPARLGIGSTGQVLTVAGGVPSWATPAGGGGKVLQVVSTTSSTTVNNSTNTLSDSNLSLAITPSATSSKILVLTSQVYFKNPGNQYSGIKSVLLRGATQVALISNSVGYLNADGYNVMNIAYHYLDSPSTTSATTYKIQFCNNTNAASVSVSGNGTELATMILMEIGA